MSGNVKTQIGKIIGKTLNSYYPRVKPTIDNLKFKQEYQNRIIECMVGEVDDNYITTPETDNPITKLEHSKEGLVKVPTVKGKTILVDADGNETDTPREGCRLVSVGEQEDNKLIISSKNKNLFNKTNIIYKKYFSGGGTLGGTIKFEPSNRHCCVLIKVQPNTNYVFNSQNLLCYLREMQTETMENGSIFAYSKKHYFITKDGTNYLAINIRLEDESGTITSRDVDTSNIIVTKTTEGESYVEPKHHKTEILLDKPLRKINSNIYDEIIGNKIIRRIGKIVLNGSETYREYEYVNNRLKNVVGYFVRMGDMKLHSVTLCNLLPSCPYNEADDIGCKVGGSPDIHLYFPKSLITSKEVFTQYISENNVEVLYELEEPIIEELPNGITLQGFDDTTMYIENSITPTVSYGYNALIPYKNELSNQKEEVEVNTLDIENNIIPYLMDMEFNLIMMEDEE